MEYSIEGVDSTKKKNLKSALYLDDIRPTGGWILALEIMLDGIGKNISLALTVFLRVLLRTEHDGL